MPAVGRLWPSGDDDDVDENFNLRQALLRSESPTRGLGQFRSGRSSSFAGGILTMLTILGVTEAQLQ